MPCPSTNGAETQTGLLSCSGSLCPQDRLRRTPQSLSPLLYAQIHLLPHIRSVYFKRMVIITPQMSHHRMALPVSPGRSQEPQGPCWNKPPSHQCVPQKTPPGIYFLDVLFQPCPSTSYYISPPLINSLSRSPKTTCSKILKSGSCSAYHSRHFAIPDVAFSL